MRSELQIWGHTGSQEGRGGTGSPGGSGQDNLGWETHGHRGDLGSVEVRGHKGQQGERFQGVGRGGARGSGGAERSLGEGPRHSHVLCDSPRFQRVASNRLNPFLGLGGSSGLRLPEICRVGGKVSQWVREQG